MITVDSVNGKSVKMLLELTCTDRDVLPTNATGGYEGYRISNGSIAQVISTTGGGLTVKIFSSEDDQWYDM